MKIIFPKIDVLTKNCPLEASYSQQKLVTFWTQTILWAKIDDCHQKSSRNMRIYKPKIDYINQKLTLDKKLKIL